MLQNFQLKLLIGVQNETKYLQCILCQLNILCDCYRLLKCLNCRCVQNLIMREKTLGFRLV